MTPITAEEKIWFTRGLLIGTAICRGTLEYEEAQRLIRVGAQQMGDLLEAVRKDQLPNDPDLTSLVVSVQGRPGKGWGDISQWRAMVRRVWEYWRDRADLYNADFIAKHGGHATFPGLFVQDK